LKRLLALAVIVLCSMTANATQLIVDQRPYYARSVAGTVTDAVGYALAGVTVQMVSCEASNGNAGVLKQTVSDAHGAFGFGRFTTGKACLRFSKDGFDVVQITVFRSQDALELALKLPVAT